MILLSKYGLDHKLRVVLPKLGSNNTSVSRVVRDNYWCIRDCARDHCEKMWTLIRTILPTFLAFLDVGLTLNGVAKVDKKGHNNTNDLVCPCKKHHQD